MFKFLLAIVSGFSLTVSASELQLIYTTGAAEKYVEPNMVVISIESFGRSELAKVAQERQSNEFKRIKAAVDKYKVKKEDFTTEGLSLTPEYKYDEKSQTNRTIGYKVSHQSRVVLRQKSDAGLFLDSLASANKADHSGVVVNSIQWDIDNRKAIAESLVEEAVLEARKKADLLAKAAGVKIKAVQSINYSDASSVADATSNFKFRATAASRGGGTELGNGSIQIRTEVSAQYRME